MVLYDNVDIPAVPKLFQPVARKTLELITYGGVGYMLYIGAKSLLSQKFCTLDYVDLVKNGSGECPVMDLSSADNVKMVNTMGLLMEEIAIRHEMSSIKLATVNVIGNILTYVVMVVMVIALIYYIFSSIYNAIVSRLSKFQGAIDKIDKIYDLLANVIKKSIDQMKKIVENIINKIKNPF